MVIHIKRAYNPPAREDGFRILVDRLWPRGIAKDTAKIGLWLKEIAPSNELRRWFNHDLKKWEGFKTRYFKELDKLSDAVGQLVSLAKGGTITLVFGARDENMNNAAALKKYLEKGYYKK
ncbi:MAG: DUF488 domain-containing protein [Nitrospirae bacterium]|nr:DUF488 domain-containing protein [Nitrospirota bacterium]